MRLIIAGGRDFDKYSLLKQKCDYFLQNTVEQIEIVSSKCRGADKLGEDYAKEKGWKIHPFPADWDKYGKAAGHIRNGEMARFATHLIAFWDEKSKGTKDMIEQATENGLKIKVVKY